MAKKICIDLGHGGNSGASKPGFQEDQLIFVTATECIRILREAGFEVKQTRTENKNLTLDARAAMSNAFKADFFMSIHYNAGGGEGFEAIRTLRESTITTGIVNGIVKRLSQIGQVPRSRVLFTKEGSGGKDYYGVLRGTTCPAIIVEGAFLDNAKDQNRINSDAKLKAFGRIYAEAIIEYFGGTIPRNQPVAPTPTPAQPPKEKLTPIITPNISPNIPRVSMGEVISGISALNVRPTPSVDKTPVGKLYSGNKVNIVSLEGDWYKILYNNANAYIHKQYVKV